MVLRILYAHLLYQYRPCYNTLLVILNKPQMKSFARDLLFRKIHATPRCRGEVAVGLVPVGYYSPVNLIPITLYHILCICIACTRGSVHVLHA